MANAKPVNPSERPDKPHGKQHNNPRDLRVNIAKKKAAAAAPRPAKAGAR